MPKEWTEEDQEKQDRFLEFKSQGYSDFDARELAKYKNAPMPSECPKCGGPLAESTGYVGELVLYCPDPECSQGVAWEDIEGAVRRVL